MSRLQIERTGRVSRYTCEDMDTGLPVHSHKPGSGLEHDVHCEIGSVLVYVLPNEHHIVRAGETLQIDKTRWHGLVPLEVGTVFVNTNSLDNEGFISVLDQPHEAPKWVLDLRTAYEQREPDASRTNQ